jgi:hypothetical protein
VTEVLVDQRRTAEPHSASPRAGRGPRHHHPHRGRRWVVLVVSLTFTGVALGGLLFDAAQADHRYDHARQLLAETRDSTAVVARELGAARLDLRLVTQRVGTDSTALTQDTSQLEGARAALSAAQAHVFEQASLLNSLHACLAGVERALNALAVGYQAKAADALQWVATPCSTAVDASG